MRPKKIILFISSLGGGGAQRQITSLALLLNKQIDVEVLIYHEDLQFGHCLEDQGIPITLIKKRGKIDLLFLFRLYTYFKKNKDAIFLSYLTTPNLYNRLIGALAGVRAVITSERNTDLALSRLKVLLEKITFPLSDCVVVNSEAIRQMYRERLALDKENIFVINNVINFEKYSSDAIDIETHAELWSLDFPADKKIICLPARIQRQKNHTALVQAYALLPPDVMKDHILLFAGNLFDQVYVSEIKQLGAALGVENRIYFSGPITDMRALYNVVDLVVLPSLYEGFPNVVVEAMACEAVVLASKVASNSLIVESGLEGFLFDLSDPKDLCQKLLSALTLSVNERKFIGRQAREKVMGLCGEKGFLDAYLKLIFSFEN